MLSGVRCTLSVACCPSRGMRAAAHASLRRWQRHRLPPPTVSTQAPATARRHQCPAIHGYHLPYLLTRGSPMPRCATPASLGGPCRVQDHWVAPGYVVRKPLGAVGDAGSLPYAPSIYRACGMQRGAASRRPGMSALRHATPRRDGPQAQARGRCWAWRFERDRRAFEYGAHDYGIGDRTGFHSANVRQRGLPPMPHAAPSRQCLQRARFSRVRIGWCRGARGGAVVGGCGRLPGGTPATITDRR
jgi:hypothetical protein